MIQEEGIVVGIEGGNALVKTKRSPACDKCSSKDLCKPDGRSEEMTVEAENSLGAKVGEKVYISIGADKLLITGMMVYLFPLGFFLVGVFIGQVAGEKILPSMDKDLLSFLLGVVLLFLSFIGVGMFGRSVEGDEAYAPKIEAVL